MSKIRLMTCLICMSLMVGCATKTNWPKHFERKLAVLDRKGLVLATVTFDNELDKSDSLVPQLFLIGKKGNDDYEKYSFLLGGGKHLRALTENRSFYLTVMEVNPGNYFFYSVRGWVIGDIFRPRFEAPMLVNFQVKKNEILYIDAFVKSRKSITA